MTLRFRAYVWMEMPFPERKDTERRPGSGRFEQTFRNEEMVVLLRPPGEDGRKQLDVQV